MKAGIFDASKSHESLEHRLKGILRKFKTKKKHGKKRINKTRKVKRGVKGRKVTLKEKKSKKKRGSKK